MSNLIVGQGWLQENIFWTQQIDSENGSSHPANYICLEAFDGLYDMNRIVETVMAEPKRHREARNDVRWTVRVFRLARSTTFAERSFSAQGKQDHVRETMSLTQNLGELVGGRKCGAYGIGRWKRCHCKANREVNMTGKLNMEPTDKDECKRLFLSIRVILFQLNFSPKENQRSCANPLSLVPLVPDFGQLHKEPLLAESQIS